MAHTVGNFRETGMKDKISTVWTKSIPDNTKEKLREILSQREQNDIPLQVFFRADDIAFVDEPFRKLMNLFLAHEMPLCLAIVPEWVDRAGWKSMEEFSPKSPLWCWHQHGTRHLNYESQGKKCEFGDSRSEEEIRKDIVDGRDTLVRIIGDLFFPVFTPPWNRCSLKTLDILKELKFKAVSRSAGAIPPAKDILPDLAVNVDLHTRKENDFTESWQNLLSEFQTAAQKGRMGIMLHHQRMNDSAFAFLDLLLTELGSCRNVSYCTFREVL